MSRRTHLLEPAPARRRAALPAALALLPLAAAAQDAAPAALEFRDGQAQVVEAFNDPSKWIRENLWVETSFDSDGDGELDRMHVDVTRPGQTETEGLRVPVIYETSPYYAGTGTTEAQFMWNPRHPLNEFPPFRNEPPSIAHQGPHEVISTTHVNDWVPRGFAVVHSESPGTGMSDGCPTTGGDNEALAPKAVIDWLNQRAKGFTTPDGDEEVVATWATGKVGMTGTSYNGTLSIAAATTGVEGLEAIIPVAPLTSYYHYYRSNGLIKHPFGYMGEDIDVLYDFIHSGPSENRDYCNDTIRDGTLLEGFDRLNGDYNDFWDGRNYRKKLEKFEAATLMAHAFNDWNVQAEHSVLFYLLLREKGVPTQAYFHQGGHGGPPPLAQMNRWFTRYVCGVENGVEDDPRSWVVRETDSRLQPTPYPEYPHPEAQPVELRPEAGGASVGRLSPTAPDGQGSEILVDDVSLSGAELAQAEASKHRLIYATPELTEPLHISGTPRIEIRVASNRPQTNLSIWLVSLPWTKAERITDNVITRGWADPQNHASLTEGEPMVPGELYDLEFDLQADDQVIPAGQSIGLMIFASDRDYTLWPPPGTELIVDLDGTSLSLPVVGGGEAFRRAIGEIGE